MMETIEALERRLEPPDARFLRLEALMGSRRLEILSGAVVAAAGLGGVGSWAVEALARAGVGGFVLYDPDVVQYSNFNRQLHALEENVGRPKVEVAAERIASISPGAVVEVHRRRFDAAEVRRLVESRGGAGASGGAASAGGVLAVMDAFDDLPRKVEVALACRRYGLPLAVSCGAASRLDPTLVRRGDLFEVRGCPLAAAMRKRLRRCGVRDGVPAVYSLEHADKRSFVRADDGGTYRGTSSVVPPVFGFVLASLVIDLILGAAEGAGGS